MSDSSVIKLLPEIVGNYLAYSAGETILSLVRKNTAKRENKMLIETPCACTHSPYMHTTDYDAECTETGCHCTGYVPENIFPFQY